MRALHVCEGYKIAACCIYLCIYPQNCRRVKLHVPSRHELASNLYGRECQRFVSNRYIILLQICSIQTYCCFVNLKASLVVASSEHALGEWTTLRAPCQAFGAYPTRVLWCRLEAGAYFRRDRGSAPFHQVSVESASRRSSVSACQREVSIAFST